MSLKSRRTAHYNYLQRAFASLQKASFIVSYVDSVLPSYDSQPSKPIFFVHILFDLLCHLLFIRATLDRMADHMFCFFLHLRLHFRVLNMNTPSLLSFVNHIDVSILLFLSIISQIFVFFNQKLSKNFKKSLYFDFFIEDSWLLDCA